MSLTSLEFSIPSWVPYAAAAIVLAARFMGLQAGWMRTRAFADPALQGVFRRPVREAICLVLLAAGTGAIVGQFATSRPTPLTPAGPVLIIFDTTLPEVAASGFQQRYTAAQLSGGMAARLLAHRHDATYASMATSGDREDYVAGTRDLAGLVSRMTTLVSVAGAQSGPQGGRGIAETVRLLKDRYPRSNRMCVLTARRPDEIIEELRATPMSGTVVVAGAVGETYFLSSDSGGTLAGTTEDGARSALSRAVPADRQDGRSGFRSFQILALTAFLALAFEWVLRLSRDGAARRPS